MRHTIRASHIGTLAWAAFLVATIVGGLCLMGKFRRPPRHLSEPPHDSLPMPPSTPDRG